MSATPDTGCTTTIIADRLAKKENMTFSEDNKTVLMAANGNRMAITGKTTIHMQANGVQATSEVLVSPDIMKICSSAVKTS